MKYRKIVIGILVNNKEVLLVKKSHWKWWGFPKGGIKKGETPDKTLLRELKEELNTINFGKLIDTKIMYKILFSPKTLKYYPDRGNIGEEQHYFIVNYQDKKDKLKISNELSDFKWVPAKDVIQKIYKGDIKPTKKVLEFIYKPA